MLYLLPNDILRHIYEYDGTYVSIFDEGPLNEISQIQFYRNLIKRNQVFVTILRWSHPTLEFADAIYKEVIREVVLNSKYRKKIKGLEFYEAVYSFYGRMYINCRRKTFT